MSAKRSEGDSNLSDRALAGRIRPDPWHLGRRTFGDLGVLEQPRPHDEPHAIGRFPRKAIAAVLHRQLTLFVPLTVGEQGLALHTGGGCDQLARLLSCL
jgi:hypothetical protein